MPSSLRSPKSLANWIELDYHRRRGQFRRWWWGVGIALAATLVGLAVMGPLLYGHRAFYAGPLSRPHALFDQDCRLCHTGEGGTPLARLWSGDTVSSVPNTACLSCHSGAHHNAPHAPMGRCVDCHKEHRGHSALARVPDATCTACHANLKRADGSPPGAPYRHAEPYQNVTEFSVKGHPAFRYWHGNQNTYPDPGRLRFNHAAHLAEGGVLELDPKQLEKQEAELKRRGSAASLPRSSRRRVLQCADCHQTDDAGRYMLPVSYDRHCQSCHPVGTPILGDWKDGPKLARAAAFFSRRLAHPKPGEGPAVVRASLRDQLTRFIQSGPDAKLFLAGPEGEEAPRPLPDRHPVRETPPVAEREFAWVNRTLAASERVLFDGAGGCTYCHLPDTSAKAPPASDGLPRLLPTNLKSRWWGHAKFSHASHRLLECAECHDARKSDRTSDVLLPGIDNCLKCHNRALSPTARADCAECHAYHDPKEQRRKRDEGGTWKVKDLKAAAGR